jgi:hypothetical protein
MSDSTDPIRNEPVDAVILWVDGNDMKLAAKREHYRLLEKKSRAHPGAIPTRFASSNEIQYCILSLLTFAGFIRNIYVVTDDQDPDLHDVVSARFPGREECLKIVDHREIFRDYEQFLPTFNSSSILAMVSKIPGLSERYVCFSDDVIIIREIKEDDWFIGNRPVLMGSWRLPPFRLIAGNKLKVLINRHIRNNKEYRPKISFYIRQWQCASLLGFRGRYFFHDHSPHPFSKPTVENFFAANPELLEKTISYRFRDPDQLLASSVAYHLELLDGNRNIRKPRLGYFHPWYSESRMNRRIRRCNNDPRIKSICIQSIEMISPSQREKIFGWMDEILERKS